MRGVLKALSTIHPITATEFSESIQKIWRWPKSHRQTPRRLGLAISGGVDSMALAYLVNQLVHNTTLQAPTARIEPFAFIVDHGIRANSTEEAWQVSSWLNEKLQIPSEILTIQIPTPSSGSQSKVEQLARTCRFRAIGMACYKHLIDSLLLAHHRNDQVETALLRLYLGGKNLRGIAPAGEIPECEGIYGVHQSGGTDLQDPTITPNKHVDWLNSRSTGTRSRYVASQTTTVRPESGGVQVLRPLLDFPKERLIATCNHHQIPWAEDSTNADARYTVRNTIRHLLEHKRLPKALQEVSLNKRIKRISCRLDHLDKQALEVLRESRTLLDPRNGVLSIQVTDFIPDHIGKDDHSIRDYRVMASLLVKHLVDAVTPRAQISLSRMHGAVAELFPRLYPSRVETTNRSSGSHLTVGEVSITKGSSKYLPSDWDHSSASYRFMRQKPHSSLANASALSIPSVIGIRGECWGDWQLFDGRFWIRVVNPQGHALVMRPFHPKDIPLILSWAGNAEGGSASMRRVLQHVAPMGMWHVIPALAKIAKQDVLPSASKSKNKSNPNVQIKQDPGLVIALPTLCWLDPKEKAYGLRTDAKYRKLLLPLERSIE